MKLTKKQIRELKNAHKKAKKIESELAGITSKIADLIKDFTGVEGACDHLHNDGFGFTPVSDNDTHIPIDELIEYAENGIDITEEFILDNLTI